MLAAEAGVEEFIKRLTPCTLTGNVDMHLKNVSLVHTDKRPPACDLVSTIPCIEDDDAAFRFAKTRHFEGCMPDELTSLAGKAGARHRETEGGAFPRGLREKNHLSRSRSFRGVVRRAIARRIRRMEGASPHRKEGIAVAGIDDEAVPGEIDSA